MKIAIAILIGAAIAAVAFGWWVKRELDELW